MSHEQNKWLFSSAACCGSEASLCRLTQAGAGTGAFDDGVFARVVKDRAFGQRDVRRHPRDGYPETAIQLVNREHLKQKLTGGNRRSHSHLPSNLCFRKSKSAFCIMSVT